MQHRKLLGAGVLLSAAVALTAFGLSPQEAADTSDSAQQAMTTVVAHSEMDTAPELNASSLELLAHTQTRQGDTAQSLLQRLGINDSQAESQLRASTAVRQILNTEPRTHVRAKTNEQGQLSDLSFTWLDQRKDTQAQQLSLTLQADGTWSEQSAEVPLIPRTRLISGSIQSSLFAATDALDVPDNVAISVAEVFANDIDFRRDLRKNDRFTIAYEELTVDGEVMRAGRMLATEFINRGQTLQAIWFADKGEYFDANGESSKRQFLSSPMKFSRVTSGFKLRFHPIQKKWKRHLGVDYGAPTGTPVRTVGAGRVVYAGVKGGYGNVVEVQHDRNNRTLYAHLSKIYVRSGQSVEREQDIGAVGATGWATGPHLHFEFQQNGQHKDPLVLAKQSKALTLTPAELAAFAPIAKEMLATLASGGSTQTASAQ